MVSCAQVSLYPVPVSLVSSAQVSHFHVRRWILFHVIWYLDVSETGYPSYGHVRGKMMINNGVWGYPISIQTPLRLDRHLPAVLQWAMAGKSLLRSSGILLSNIPSPQYQTPRFPWSQCLVSSPTFTMISSQGGWNRLSFSGDDIWEEWLPDGYWYGSKNWLYVIGQSLVLIHRWL